MKKFVLSVCFFYSSMLFANCIYDPVSHTIYTLPIAKDINQREYRMLMQRCWQISERIKVAKCGLSLSNQEIMDQCINYLNQVGSPTAKRLIEDLKKDTIFYPDGSVLSTMFV